jgi:hypothetical protein
MALMLSGNAALSEKILPKLRLLLVLGGGGRVGEIAFGRATDSCPVVFLRERYEFMDYSL